jgi:DNA-binding transcriptional ArsR family regulator
MKPKARLPTLPLLEQLISLSVELHNLNAGVQRRFGISIVQWLVLRKIVERPGISAGTLAEISGVHPSTLTPTISRLASMGLIYVQEHPADLRRKLLICSFDGFEVCHRSAIAFQHAFMRHPQPTEIQESFEDVRFATRTLLANLTDHSGSKTPSTNRSAQKN